MRKNVDYIVISDLPIDQQRPFENWLKGQSMPMIESEGESRYKCAYKWDYDRWIEYSSEIANATMHF